MKGPHRKLRDRPSRERQFRLGGAPGCCWKCLILARDPECTDTYLQIWQSERCKRVFSVKRVFPPVSETALQI